jgi:hypothetical protein
MFPQQTPVGEIVIVKKEKNGCARRKHPEILGRRDCGVIDTEILKPHLPGKAFTYLARRICRTIVNHDDLIKILLQSLTCEALQAALEQRGAIKRRNDDANERRGHLAAVGLIRSGEHVQHPEALVEWEVFMFA